MLHLIRNFPPRHDGRPRGLEAFFRRTIEWRKTDARVGFWTRRRPRRSNELYGGSVYLVVRGETVFRMPFEGIEQVRDFAPRIDAEWLDDWAIVCRPETMLVEARRVDRMQGWRYLDPDEALKDVPRRERSRTRRQTEARNGQNRTHGSNASSRD